MADFCNVCSKEMFGKKIKPGIDVYKILEEIKANECYPVLCEGCGLNLIGKNKNDKPILHFYSSEHTIDVEHTMEDWKSGRLKQF
jgi:hypothetical protein